MKRWERLWLSEWLNAGRKVMVVIVSGLHFRRPLAWTLVELLMLRLRLLLKELVAPEVRKVSEAEVESKSVLLCE